MIEEVKQALEIIRPALQADGGDVQLVGVTEDGVVQVKLTGACGHCPMSTMTLKMGIEKKAISYFEELERNTTDPEGKSMFRTLIAEEQEHHRIITGKYQALMST